MLLSNPLRANAPIIQKLVLIEGNTLKAFISPTSPKFEVLGTYYWESDIDYLLSQYDWDLWEAHEIKDCESNGNPLKINWKDYHKTGKCYGSFGLFQLACFRGTQEELLDPATNVRLAYELYSKNGWSKDWVKCYKKL